MIFYQQKSAESHLSATVKRLKKSTSFKVIPSYQINQEFQIKIFSKMEFYLISFSSLNNKMLYLNSYLLVSVSNFTSLCGFVLTKLGKFIFFINCVHQRGRFVNWRGRGLAPNKFDRSKFRMFWASQSCFRKIQKKF